MILISKTYTQITPESAEMGAHSDSGFLFQDEPHTFRELVRLMRMHTQCSDYPARTDGMAWFSSGYSVQDYRTGTEQETSIHYSRANEVRSLKYWAKAARAAGIIP